MTDLIERFKPDLLHSSKQTFCAKRSLKHHLLCRS